MGKSAPDTIHMGTSSKFIIAWNPDVEFIRHAITKPRPVSVNEIRNTDAAIGISSAAVTRTPASGGTAGFNSRGDSGSACNTCASVSAALAPMNGARPVSK